MDPITMALIGGGVNILGGLLGNILSSGDEEKKRELLEEAYRLYGNISVPSLEKVLAEKIKTSGWENVAKEFGNKGARDMALQRLVDMGMQGGMDDQSRLALEQANRSAALQEAQGRASVRQEARRRGLGGQSEVYGQLQAQQAGADRASMGGLQAAADARSRALQALATGGGMAQAAESADFGQAAARAEAADRIAMYNSQMAQQAYQQNFQNRLALADRKYDATVNRANAYGDSADRTRRMVGGIGQAVGWGATMYGQYGQPQAPQVAAQGQMPPPPPQMYPQPYGPPQMYDPYHRR